MTALTMAVVMVAMPMCMAKRMAVSVRFRVMIVALHFPYVLPFAPSVAQMPQCSKKPRFSFNHDCGKRKRTPCRIKATLPNARPLSHNIATAPALLALRSTGVNNLSRYSVFCAGADLYGNLQVQGSGAIRTGLSIRNELNSRPFAGQVGTDEMQLKFFLAASAASISLACGMVAAPAMAQETSSAVRGSVTSGSAPIAGATVTVTHDPSGTTAVTTTANDGTFAVNGLRVGGPFTVTVEADGFQVGTINDLYLEAGVPVRLPVSLQAEQQIVVSASSVQPRIKNSDGPTTALGRAEIDNAASINRDIRDLARRDPLVTIDLTNSRTIEIAGNNGRLNRFSVDGMQMSDDFGLNNGGLPTNRGPVPYDAIEQFSVKVAPYDIAEGDMQGGAINVVLRSGGNKLHGGGFFSYTNDGLTGSKTKNVNVALDFNSKQYGGWLSGPIIKDKLFFMAAYERTKEGKPIEDGVGPAFANQVPGITQAEIDSVTQIAQTRFGYDTQGLLTTAQEQDEKIVAKLDWNISDGHRAALTYIRNVGTNQFQQNNFLTPVYGLGLKSNGYELREEVNSGTFELNSSWSDTFSTTLRASYRDYNRSQTPFGGQAFPNMEICLDPTSVNSGSNSATSCGSERLFIGPDVSRHSNALNTDNLSIDLTARVELGSQSLRLMAGYTTIDTFNLFLQRSLGDFYFDSIADFQSGLANRLRYQNAVPSNDPNDAAAQFTTRNWTFGIQDEWEVSDSLNVSVGLRYDLFDNNPPPPLNANFTGRYGFSNRATFKGRALFQPRMAFTWEPTDRLIVRGGVGIFGGGTPDVFLSNVFSNTGQLTNQVDINRSNCVASGNTCSALGTLANPLTSGAIPQSVINYLTTNVASLASAATDVIDPNLRLANKMKVSLQADYSADLGPLGDDWMFGVQFLYDKTIDAYMWTDLRSVPVGTLPDGRVRYGAFGGIATTNRDLMLTNTSDGRGIFGTFRFEKKFGRSVSIDGSYTRSDVKDRSALTSSTSSSNYGNNAFTDPNIPEYGRSIYEYRDQWKFGINLTPRLFGDNKTSFGLFGEYRSGRPYSITMLDRSSGRGSVFGTVGNLGNMLLYVPTTGGDPRVVFGSDTVNGVTTTATQNEANFNALVTSLGLEKFRGQIVPKNSQTSPDFFKIDLHFGQEIPLPVVNGAKFELFADIENALNLIDKDWGALRQFPFPYNAALVTVTCLATTNPTNSCGQYQYTRVTSPNVQLQARQSLYGIRVGARVKF
ncbi:TonB-dependent receptor domain-containing protein [Novosphingobium aquiterrae]|uniref:TonB-dependent receptor domain-containing protein n=1 Tax=Novosphingobium aquiterrae TaxID=624388 RepID=A0ABV6PFD2_9SPHN